MKFNWPIGEPSFLYDELLTIEEILKCIEEGATTELIIIKNKDEK